ncbi:FAD dependent oxidoreductase [Wolfiporia cocos MD-104 SS10]|uniref:FAD dependent oxidoreductase n=1 Tax=Wolfiporia cocos (strain MD-104) TaxID=742152 RepID=A0A2H3IW26_WOLCO|nr:FAD dependent oxidoreductase [Wolfiporia cocos MD-104 SS10]
MADSTTKTEVVILGAGVIGLSIAHVLTTKFPNAYNVRIVARDMPGDLSSQAFASPWAGANWSPIGGFDERTHKRETATFNKLWDMIPTGLVLSLPSRIYYHTADGLDQLWYKDLVRDFRVMDASEVPAGAKGGVRFTTVSVSPEAYLPWLHSELSARGVQFVRRRVHSLGEAAALAGPRGILVNATGLGARSLVGVEDAAVFPIRGQTVIVHAPAITEFVSFPLDSPSPNGEATHMIPRPSPAGNVLLGGTFQPGNWDTSMDAATARGILARCAALAPVLASKETQVLGHNVGLRPARKGGPRVEVEWVDTPLQSELLPVPESSAAGRVMVVHAYGFGPAGYQNSWGAAEEVTDLIQANINAL